MGNEKRIWAIYVCRRIVIVHSIYMSALAFRCMQGQQEKLLPSMLTARSGCIAYKYARNYHIFMVLSHARQGQISMLQTCKHTILVISGRYVAMQSSVYVYVNKPRIQECTVTPVSLVGVG